MPKRENLPDVPNAAKIEQGPSMSAAMAPALGLAALGGDIAQTATGIHRDAIRTQDMKDKGHLSDVRHQMSLAQDEHEAYRKVSSPDTWQHDWNTRVDNVKRHALGDPENPVSLLTPNYERLERMMDHWQERGHADVAGAAQAAELRHATDIIKGNIRHAVTNGDFNGAKDQASFIDDRFAREKAYQFIDHAEQAADKANDRADYIEGSVGPGYAVALEKLEKDTRFPEADKASIRRSMEITKRRTDDELLDEITDKIKAGEITVDQLETEVPEHILPETRRKFIEAVKRRADPLEESTLAEIRNGIHGLMSTFFKLRQEHSGVELDQKYLEARQAFKEQHITPNQLNESFKDNVEGFWNKSGIDSMKQMAAALDANKDDPDWPGHIENRAAEIEAGIDPFFDRNGAIERNIRNLKAAGTWEKWGINEAQAKHEFTEMLPELITRYKDDAIGPRAPIALWNKWVFHKNEDFDEHSQTRKAYFPPGGHAFADMVKKANLTQEDIDLWKSNPDARGAILIKLRRAAGEMEADTNKHVEEGGKFSGADLEEGDKLRIMEHVLSDLPYLQERSEADIAEDIMKSRDRRKDPRNWMDGGSNHPLLPPLPR